MKWSEFLIISLASLQANKIRTFLTMLGIIIGVAAVITMISLGQGAKKAVADRMEAMGTNLIYIISGQPHMRGRVRSAAGSTQKLDAKDLKRLQTACTTTDLIAPELRGSKQIVYGNQNCNTTVIGTSPEYIELRDFRIDEGEMFSQRDVNSIKRVAVIGPVVAENLFGKSYPIGKTIRIGRLRFEVIGVTKTKGVSGGWLDFDDIILVPYTTAQKRIFGIDHLSRLIAHLKDEKMLSAAYLEIEKILRKSHRLRPDYDNDFFIQSQSDFISARQETTQTLSYLLAGVALVSLLVGGIGIMNIMLVSVTERTREIGVRMAIGARRSDILMQFMMESISLSLFGGIIGILTGIGGSYVMSELFGWNTLIAPEAVVLSFIFASAVGLFFGIYPARKASRLDPIEALRYE
ncbi:MAG: ABC transporter permease [candidate division Zixibacteria bacterium]|nr:ABC transporter permease [candidate division Zixibacteria bacterium]